MTDEPIEPISGPSPGHIANVTEMAGNAPTGNPFLTPTRSIPPEIQAIPARTPGFAPRQRSATGGHAVVRPAAGFDPPPQAPPPPQIPQPQQPPPPYDQDPGAHEVPWQPFEPAPDFSRRRNNLVIGASAAAAVAVAIGAISLTHKSASTNSASAPEKFSAAFGPGAGDPTEDPHLDGQPLDGSPSAPGSALVNQAPNAIVAAPPAVAAPPKPNPATAKPPPPKPAAVCTGWHTTHTPAQDGKGFAAGASALRAGPYATCATVGATFSSGQHMYVWCHAVNVYGATWVYGRMDGTSAPGWQAVTALRAGAKLGPVC